MEKFEIIPLADPTTIARTAASNWLDEVKRAAQAGQKHSVALSGGRIARNFCEAVAELAAAGKISFGHVHFFWGDERCVPPTDAESNFALAEKALLSKISIPAANIHRIRGEDKPANAAKLAADDLLNFFGGKNPSLDVVLLGMGEDGHVASLFPAESPEVRADPAICRAVIGPKPPPNRVTFGYSMIAAAKQVWVLASGEGKREALLQSISPDGKTPLAQVIRIRNQTKLFSDIRV